MTANPQPIFLQAQWQNLAMFNYEVLPELLLPHLPKGTELDTWQGNHLVSLVGFMFAHTKVFGLKWPWHTHFEEINLRFYVRRQVNGVWRRGAAFISEIVPKAAIALIANGLYNEHYRRMPTRHTILNKPEQLSVQYGFKHQHRWNSVSVVGQAQAIPMEPASIEQFILEHYWGYNQLNANTTIEYAVEHPSWLVHPVVSHQIDLDTEAVYGPEWLPYLQGQPHSVMLAKGSDVAVRKPLRLAV